MRFHHSLLSSLHQRLELGYTSSIKVVLIEPGSVVSNIVDTNMKTVEKNQKNIDPQTFQLYRPLLERLGGIVKVAGTVQQSPTRKVSKVIDSGVLIGVVVERISSCNVSISLSRQFHGWSYCYVSSYLQIVERGLRSWFPSARYTTVNPLLVNLFAQMPSFLMDMISRVTIWMLPVDKLEQQDRWWSKL